MFTREMAYVMHGSGSREKSPAYIKFVDLCAKAFNVLRKNARVLIVLFQLMIPAGIPELSSDDDIGYLRDKLALDLDDAAAAKQIKKEIKSGSSFAPPCFSLLFLCFFYNRILLFFLSFFYFYFFFRLLALCSLCNLAFTSRRFPSTFASAAPSLASRCLFKFLAALARFELRLLPAADCARRFDDVAAARCILASRVAAWRSSSCALSGY